MNGIIQTRTGGWCSSMLCCAFALAGCGSAQTQQSRSSTSADGTKYSNLVAIQSPVDGSQAPQPVTEGDEGFVGPGSNAVSQPIATTPVQQKARPLPTNARTRDGRPQWWLSEPQRVNGRVSLCAEALGTDIRDARRNAVEKGLDLLNDEILEAIHDAQVVYVTVRPLPIPAEAPGGARFAGYVMVSGVVDNDG